MTMPAQFPALQQRGLAKFIKLALDFSANEVLDPRITFSRTSNATRTNAQGLIEYAPHNLLTNSENFDSASWVKSPNATATANLITAPDGTITCDKISYLGSSTAPQQTVSSSTTTYSFSAFVKKGNTSFCRLSLGAAAGGSGTSVSVHFNIDTGVVSAVGAATADFGSITAIITQAANGFYRISITFTVLTATTSIAYSIIAAQVSGGGSSNGDEIYIWGAQLNIGSLQPYYTTSVKNLLGYSQEFSNAAWTKSNSTIDATPVMGPFGYLSAMKLVEDTAISSSHRLRQILAVNTGISVTISVYAKAGGRNTFDLFDAYSSKGAYFNLTNGVASAPQASGLSIANNVSIDSLGGDWYRCSITVTTATTSASFSLLLSNGSSTTYTGDGTSGIYIYGAQLSDSASLDPYSYNTGAAPTSSAYYGPRFDYDPVTLAPKGLLIEESRTNLLTYSEQFNNNAVWTLGAGLTVSPNTAISPDGTNNADTITANGSGAVASIYYDNITVTASTSYTFSIYVKLGTLAASDYKIAVYNVTGSTFIAADVAPTQVVNSSSWTRITYTFTTPVGCVSARVYPYRNSATVTNATMYFWGAQLEAGSFPTSYIPTTSAQVTRAADNASMVGTNFSSWYNQSEGTVVAECINMTRTTSIQYPRLVSLVGTNANIDEISIYTISSGTDAGKFRAAITASGTNTFDQGINTLADSWKGAICYKSNDSNCASSGLIGTNDNSVVLPNCNALLFFGTVRYQQMPSGHIKSFKFFSKRFINTYLQSLTQ